MVRQDIVRLWIEERIRNMTNERVRAQRRAGRELGPESSIGKIHQAELNQRMHEFALAVQGPHAMLEEGSPHAVEGFLEISKTLGRLFMGGSFQRYVHGDHARWVESAIRAQEMDKRATHGNRRGFRGPGSRRPRPARGRTPLVPRSV